MWRDNLKFFKEETLKQFSENMFSGAGGVGGRYTVSLLGPPAGHL